MTTTATGSAGGPDVVARVDDLHVDITVSDGIVHAVRGVDLSLHRGEVVALVGESGSGKSVLASTLLGLRPRAASVRTIGTVTVAGTDMLSGDDRAVRSARRHLLGAVFQDPLGSLNPTMRIETQLRERGGSRERAVRDLQEVGVSDAERRLRQWPHELSGGLRQRVMLAMALGVDSGSPAQDRPHAGRRRLWRGTAAAGPEAAVAADDVSATDVGAALIDADGAPLLIVADEPTTALDVSVQAQIVLVFDRLRREHGCAVLLVTHDLGVAASVADRIVVLYAGQVCEHGPAAELLLRPRHHYTAALLASRLSVDDDTAADVIVGSPPNPLSLPDGCAFAPRCPAAQADCTTGAIPLGPAAGSDDEAHQWACLHPRDLDVARVSVRRERLPVVVSDKEPPALRLVDVSKSFRVGGSPRPANRLRAVADVSLDVPTGGAVALVGESGCGKTTLLRMACGLIRPDQGTVEWAAGSPPQLVYQDAGSSLTPWRSVGSQVEERLRARGVPRAERAGLTAELLTLRRARPARRPVARARALGWAAATGGHRPGPGRRAPHARVRRTGQRARRLPGRPRARPHRRAPAHARAVGAAGHPRPRCGALPRRRGGRDVPGADRRAGPGGGRLR